MPDVHTATQEVHCAVCGQACTPCNNTCLCPNLEANKGYLASRGESNSRMGAHEEFVGTISTRSHGPSDFH